MTGSRAAVVIDLAMFGTVGFAGTRAEWLAAADAWAKREDLTDAEAEAAQEWRRLTLPVRSGFALREANGWHKANAWLAPCKEASG